MTYQYGNGKDNSKKGDCIVSHTVRQFIDNPPKAIDKFPVDVVVTWVDGNDPIWHQEYSKYNDTPIDQERFVDVDELYYCLKSIESYLPWVRHTFLVTMRPQQPKYLEDFPNVQVIHHDQIYSNTGWLPTFNSQSIETQLANIPGLSEHFIYFNDDVFIGKPLSKKFFFTSQGKPQLHQRQRVNHFYQSTLNIIRDKYDLPLINHAPEHYAQALTRTGFQLANKLFPEEIAREAETRFRNPVDGLNFWIIGAIYRICYGTDLANYLPELTPLEQLRFFLPALQRHHAEEKLTQYRKTPPAMININNIDPNNNYHMEIYNRVIDIFNNYLARKHTT
jgi:hypothetical protein